MGQRTPCGRGDDTNVRELTTGDLGHTADENGNSFARSMPPRAAAVTAQGGGRVDGGETERADKNTTQLRMYRSITFEPCLRNASGNQGCLVAVVRVLTFHLKFANVHGSP